MLAYAASRPVFVERRPAPHAMLAIIAVHVAVAAAVMSAKMDLPQRIRNAPIMVDFIKDQTPPPPVPEMHAKMPAQPQSSVIDHPQSVVPLPLPAPGELDSRPAPLPDLGAIIGPSVTPTPKADPLPPAAPVKAAARLLTPASELRPPYPSAKLLAGEEAVLRLKLTIDERGRVVAVEPVGKADRAFLDAARRHLIAHWRYQPATEDGRPVVTSTVITLRFQLDG